MTCRVRVRRNGRLETNRLSQWYPWKAWAALPDDVWGEAPVRKGKGP